MPVRAWTHTRRAAMTALVAGVGFVTGFYVAATRLPPAVEERELRVLQRELRACEAASRRPARGLRESIRQW